MGDLLDYTISYATSSLNRLSRQKRTQTLRREQVANGVLSIELHQVYSERIKDHLKAKIYLESLMK